MKQQLQLKLLSLQFTKLPTDSNSLLSTNVFVSIHFKLVLETVCFQQLMKRNIC